MSIYVYIIIIIFSCILVRVLSKFNFMSFCSILTNFRFLGLVSIYYVLKRSQKILTLFLISIRRLNRRKHVN